MVRSAAVLVLLAGTIGATAYPGRLLSAGRTRDLLHRIAVLRKRCSRGHIVVSLFYPVPPGASAPKETLSEAWCDDGRFHEKQRTVNYDGSSQDEESFGDGSFSCIWVPGSGTLTVRPYSSRVPGGGMEGIAQAAGFTRAPLGYDPGSLGKGIIAYDEGDRYRLVGTKGPLETDSLLIRKSLAPISFTAEGIGTHGRHFRIEDRYSDYIDVEGIECATRDGNRRYSDISFRRPAAKDLRIPLDSIVLYVVIGNGAPVTLTAQDLRDRLGTRELTIPTLVQVASRDAAKAKSALREASKRDVEQLQEAVTRDGRLPLLKIVGGAIAGLLLLTALIVTAIRALREDGRLTL